jgi:hypothetical protein
MQMIKLFRIIGVGAASPANWIIGQFDTAQDALAEYNSEFRRAKSEGIDDGRPELEFVTTIARSNISWPRKSSPTPRIAGTRE